MGYKLSLDDFERYEDEHKKSASEANRPSMGGLMGGIRDLGLGAAEGAANVVPSVLNLGLAPLSAATGKNMKLPYADLRDLGGDTGMAHALHGIGAFGGEMAGAGPIFKGVKAATHLAPLLKNLPALGKSMVAGGATGAALSGSKDNELASRVLGGTLGALLPAASAMRKGKIAKETVKAYDKARAASSKEYDKVFNALKERGLHDAHMKTPSRMNPKGNGNYKQILMDNFESGNFRDRILKSVDTFKAKPNFQNAHNLQSDLNKAHTVLKEKLTQGGTQNLLSSDRAMLDKLIKRRKEVRGSMQEFLTGKGKEDILKKYAEATRNHAKTVGPYPSHIIEKIRAGKMKPKAAYNKLTGDKRFMEKGGADTVEGLKSRAKADALTKTLMETLHLKHALTGGALGSGMYGAHKILGD